MHFWEFPFEVLRMYMPVQAGPQFRLVPSSVYAPVWHLSTHTAFSKNGRPEEQAPKHSWPTETIGGGHGSTHWRELPLEAFVMKNAGHASWHTRTEDWREYAPFGHLAQQRPASE